MPLPGTGRRAGWWRRRPARGRRPPPPGKVSPQPLELRIGSDGNVESPHEEELFDRGHVGGASPVPVAEHHIEGIDASGEERAGGSNARCGPRRLRLRFQRHRPELRIPLRPDRHEAGRVREEKRVDRKAEAQSLSARHGEREQAGQPGLPETLSAPAYRSGNSNQYGSVFPGRSSYRTSPTRRTRPRPDGASVTWTETSSMEDLRTVAKRRAGRDAGRRPVRLAEPRLGYVVERAPARTRRATRRPSSGRDPGR